MEKLKTEYEVQISYTHFPLHPETPQEGRKLEDVFRGGQSAVEARRQRMAALFDEEGLPHGKRTATYNSRLAQELAKWAEGQKNGDRIHDIIFRAYFVDNKNIAEIDVLLELAEEAGLDRAEARRALEERRYEQAVNDDWTRCHRLGVSGVPTYLARGYAIVGAQPYEQLEQLVMKAGATRRK